MFERGRDDFLSRASLRLSMSMPRKVVKPKAEHHERMAEHWCKHARDLGRPPYSETVGFAELRDEASLRHLLPGTRKLGREKPYGPFSRAHWKYIRLAMREAFLAEWCRARGTTYETTEGGKRSMAVLTGITN